MHVDFQIAHQKTYATGEVKPSTIKRLYVTVRVEENIWTEERLSDRRLEKTA
jgi:hypothetical protein